MGSFAECCGGPNLIRFILKPSSLTVYLQESTNMNQFTRSDKGLKTGCYRFCENPALLTTVLYVC